MAQWLYGKLSAGYAFDNSHCRFQKL